MVTASDFTAVSFTLTKAPAGTVNVYCVSNANSTTNETFMASTCGMSIESLSVIFDPFCSFTILSKTSWMVCSPAVSTSFSATDCDLSLMVAGVSGVLFSLEPGLHDVRLHTLTKSNRRSFLIVMILFILIDCIESKRRTNSQCPNQWKHLEPTLRKRKAGDPPQRKIPCFGKYQWDLCSHY